MEIPEKDFWDDSYYEEWRIKNKIIIKSTRKIFNSLFRLGVKKDIFDYNIDWRKLIKTLYPLPKDMDNYHVDHIIPLSRFNFLHEDDSINITELKKAWSPANLRLINKEENLLKSNIINSLEWPFRFEFIFNDKNTINNLYREFKILREKQIKEWRDFMENLEW